MNITVDNSIRLLENYQEWKKRYDLDGSGVDDAINKLLEVAKRYQEIKEIATKWKGEVRSGVSCSYDRMEDIWEVLDDKS